LLDCSRSPSQPLDRLVEKRQQIHYLQEELAEGVAEIEEIVADNSEIAPIIVNDFSNKELSSNATASSLLEKSHLKPPLILSHPIIRSIKIAYSSFLFKNALSAYFRYVLYL
jgi:hypothetical protein